MGYQIQIVDGCTDEDVLRNLDDVELNDVIFASESAAWYSADDAFDRDLHDWLNVIEVPDVDAADGWVMRGERQRSTWTRPDCPIMVTTYADRYFIGYTIAYANDGYPAGWSSDYQRFGSLEDAQRAAEAFAREEAALKAKSESE